MHNPEGMQQVPISRFETVELCPFSGFETVELPLFEVCVHGLFPFVSGLKFAVQI